MADYSNKPLAQKLLIKPGDSIVPIGAPRNYRTLLGKLPDGAQVVTRAPRNGAALVHLFVETRAQLESQLPRAQQAVAQGGGIWVSWKKLTSGAKSDIGRDVIRAIAEESGLRTVRAIAIDDDWSALKLTV